MFVEHAEPAEYDLVTGRLNPQKTGARNRKVYIRAARTQPVTDEEPQDENPGEFRPCAVCGESASFGRTSVQDHQTKGDQPFQALIAKQLQVQLPSPVEATPPRAAAWPKGRDLLRLTSDGGAPRAEPPDVLDQDAMRPLMVTGSASFLHNAAPTLTADRVARSTDLLFQDLDRQGIEGLVVERDKKVAVVGLGDVVAPILVTNASGAQFAVGLHGPLMPNEPTDVALKDVKEYATSLAVYLEDELIVRRNCRPTRKLIEKLG